MRRWKVVRCSLVVLLVVSVLANYWLLHVHSCSEISCDKRPGDRLANEDSPTNSTTKLEDRRPVRLLVGITSFLQVRSERQRRHLIRNTYLDYDRLHRPNQPNRVCSFQQFQAGETSHCQLIYTFLLGPTANDTIRNQDSLILDPSLFDNHETDVLYLNANEDDRVGKLQTWFRYAGTLLEKEDAVDYVVHTDTQLAILPSEFWKNDIFQRPLHSRVYAGLPTLKAECVDLKCPSLLGDYVMRRFVLLSRDLLTYTISKAYTTSNFAPKESPDVWIANQLHGVERDLGPLTNQTIQGLIPKTSAKGLVGDYLHVWDRYKDTLTNYDDPSEIAVTNASPAQPSPHGPPRLLLGIFSTLDAKEEQRRQIIRKTHLTAFQRSNNPHCICSLHQLEQMDNEYRCQIAYTFVVGANPEGPTERLDHSASLTLPPKETDITYLNIRENMEDGKSQTWLKHATDIVRTHYFDYIGKMDSDTLLYPEPFRDNVLSTLPKYPNNFRTYGGDYRIRHSMPTLNLGPAYMGGHFYFLSVDLARYIVSPGCNRTALDVRSEDQSIGNFVHSHPQPIRRVRVSPHLFEHPIKRVDRMRTLWRKHVQQTTG